MAVEIKAIPTLRGEAAKRLIQNSEDNLLRRGSIDFSKEAAYSYAILRNAEKEGVKCGVSSK